MVVGEVKLRFIKWSLEVDTYFGDWFTRRKGGFIFWVYLSIVDC